MNRELIAKRYALALLQFAELKGEQECAVRQATLFTEAYAKESGIDQLLGSPHLVAERLYAPLRETDGRECEAMSRFFELVFKHNRQELLCDMLRSYLKLYKERAKIISVSLEVAHTPKGEEIERLRSMIAKRMEGSIDFNISVKEELIGGFRLRIEDLLIDSSIKSSLDRYRRHYTTGKNRIV